MNSCPRTIIATIVQKPLLILRVKMLSPVSKLRALNMYQKWVQTKIENSRVAS